MGNNTSNQSINKIGLVFLLLGGLATVIMCGLLAGALYLDLFGAETAGKMTNISFDADRSDNPFTAQVTFVTAGGEEVSFISWQGRSYFELDQRIQPDGIASPGNPGVKVRYIESNPKIAKVAFAYHIEYVNRIIWLFWSSAALMAGIITRRNKPVVMDLSKRKN